LVSRRRGETTGKTGAPRGGGWFPLARSVALVFRRRIKAKGLNRRGDLWAAAPRWGTEGWGRVVCGGILGFASGSKGGLGHRFCRLGPQGGAGPPFRWLLSLLLPPKVGKGGWGGGGRPGGPAAYPAQMVQVIPRDFGSPLGDRPGRVAGGFSPFPGRRTGIHRIRGGELSAGGTFGKRPAQTPPQGAPPPGGRRDLRSRRAWGQRNPPGLGHLFGYITPFLTAGGIPGGGDDGGPKGGLFDHGTGVPREKGADAPQGVGVRMTREKSGPDRRLGPLRRLPPRGLAGNGPSGKGYGPSKTTQE